MNWNPMKIDVKVVWNWDGDNKKSYRIMFKLWFDIKSTFLSEFLISFFLLHKQHCKRFLDRNSYIATWKFSHVKSWNDVNFIHRIYVCWIEALNDSPSRCVFIKDVWKLLKWNACVGVTRMGKALAKHFLLQQSS